MIKIKTTLPTENKNSKKDKKKRIRNRVLLVLWILMVFGAAYGYWFYRTLVSPNVHTLTELDVDLFIPTGADYAQVIELLDETHSIENKKSFDWVASKKDYPNNIRPGHYLIKNGMSNNQLVNMLRGGLQSPVKVTFNNIRDVDMLAGRIADQIEADSTSISNLLHNQQYINQLGFDSATIPALFLPDTYEFYWTTDAEGFVSRMFQEYNKFWNDEFGFYRQQGDQHERRNAPCGRSLSQPTEKQLVVAGRPDFGFRLERLQHPPCPRQSQGNRVAVQHL